MHEKRHTFVKDLFQCIDCKFDKDKQEIVFCDWHWSWMQHTLSCQKKVRVTKNEA